MSERFRTLIGITLVIATVAFVFWVALTGARWRGGVSVMSAESYPDGRLVLEVRSCNGNPEVSQLVETERQVDRYRSLCAAEAAAARHHADAHSNTGADDVHLANASD